MRMFFMADPLLEVDAETGTAVTAPGLAAPVPPLALLPSNPPRLASTLDNMDVCAVSPAVGALALPPNGSVIDEKSRGSIPGSDCCGDCCGVVCCDCGVLDVPPGNVNGVETISIGLRTESLGVNRNNIGDGLDVSIDPLLTVPVGAAYVGPTGCVVALNDDDGCVDGSTMLREMF